MEAVTCISYSGVSYSGVWSWGVLGRHNLLFKLVLSEKRFIHQGTALASAALLDRIRLKSSRLGVNTPTTAGMRA